VKRRHAFKPLRARFLVPSEEAPRVQAATCNESGRRGEEQNRFGRGNRPLGAVAAMAVLLRAFVSGATQIVMAARFALASRLATFTTKVRMVWGLRTYFAAVVWWVGAREIASL